MIRMHWPLEGDILMKLIFSVCLIFLLFLPSVSHAVEMRRHYYLETDNSVTGIIQAVGRNGIDIDDEYARAVKRFVYLGPSLPYHPGDRVRVYYERGSNVIRNIKKMTVLEYSKNGQNLGYVTKH